MSEQIWQLQDRAKGQAANLLLDAQEIYAAISAAHIDQGDKTFWLRLNIQLETVADTFSDVAADLETITKPK